MGLFSWIWSWIGIVSGVTITTKHVTFMASPHPNFHAESAIPTFSASPQPVYYAKDEDDG